MMQKNWLKSSVKCVVLLGAVATAAVGAETAPKEPVNLIRNPKFQEITPDGKPAFWGMEIRRGRPNPELKCEFTVGKPGLDDDSAARIVVVNPVKCGALVAYYQRIPLKPDTDYYFSGYVGYERGVWAPIGVEFLTRNFKQIGSAKCSPVGGKVNGYQKFEGTFNTGKEIHLAHVGLRLQDLGQGEAQFDNISLIELPKE